MRPRSPGTTRLMWSVIAGCVLVPPGEAASQEPAPAFPVTVGSKVRLWAPTVLQGRIEGLVTQLDDTSLVVGTLSVSRQAITQLEVSTGRRGRALRGMLVGAAIGVATGALLPDPLCAEGESCGGRGELIKAGALGGAAWGALIGHLVKSDRWSAVAPERVRVSVAPARGRGVGLFLCVAW